MVDPDSIGQRPEPPVVSLAREEAVRVGHDFIGAEHLLLGTPATRNPEVERTLAGASLSPDGGPPFSGKFPRTSPYHAAAAGAPLLEQGLEGVDLAEEAAKSSGEAGPAARHFLEALLLGGRNIAAFVLRLHGLGAAGQVRAIDPLPWRACPSGGETRYSRAPVTEP
jgi:hypothetical protein